MKMINEKRYLPSCGRRYYIDEIGYIFDNNDNEIKRYYKDGNYFVDLEWILGSKGYLVSLIVLVSFNKVTLPDHLLNEIEPLFQDNDNSNLTPANIIYRFRNGQLPVEKFPGYFYIPFFNSYGINIKGDLKNIITGKDKTWSVNKENLPANKRGGYLYSRVINSVGFSSIIFKHRAICLVFKKYDYNIFSLVVNHIDGNSSNNDINNLEWVTYSENTLHAYATGLQVGISKAVLVKNLITGVIQKFCSLEACARELNLISGKYINRRIEKNNNLFKDKLCFKYDNDSEWPEINIKNNSNYYRQLSDRNIIARNVFTGNFFIFNSSLECSKDTGVKQADINRSIRNSQVIPINGFNFNYLDDDLKWPKHSSRELQIYKEFPFHPRNGLIALNVETKEELFFTRVSKALNFFNITKAKFYHYLYNQRLYDKKYLFSFFKLPENLGHPIE